MNIKSSTSAFTLIEMLLVTVMVSMISLAVFQTFNNGFKLWVRSEQLNKEGGAAIWIDKMGEDLRATLRISNIGFKGTGMMVSFPAIVLTQADENSNRASEKLIDQIGAIQYRFEPGEHKIFRRQANYSQALKERWGNDQVIASGVQEVNFHYYYADDKGYDFKSQIEGRIPAGVKIELLLSDETGQRRIKRYFAIPVG